MKRYLRCVQDFFDKENIYEKYGVNEYIYALGLSVAPQYQGDSISYHLLKARDPLCQAIGITVSVTLFGSPAALHSGIKTGYKITREITLDKYKLDGEIFYPRLNEKSKLVLTVKTIPKLY